MKKMKLTERQKNIILMLLENKTQAITTSQIAGRLNLSARTVKRDMVTIEEWFFDNDFKLVKKPGVGLMVDEDEEMTKLISDLLKVENIEKSYKKDERIKFILSRLLVANQPIKYYAFTNYLKISDKTLTQDLIDVEEWLASLGIDLIRRPGEGVYIDGDKKSLRKAQINLIHESLDDAKRLDLIRDISIESSVELIEENDVYSMINRATLDKVKKVLSRVFKSLNLRLSDNAYIGLLVHVSLAIERLASEEIIDAKKEYMDMVSNSKEYIFSRKIVEDLEKEFDMSIPEEEIGYIAMHIKGANIIGRYNEQTDVDDIIEISRLSKKLLEEISIIFRVALGDDKRLEQDLKNHLGPALTRLRLGMKIRNPILRDIKESYKEIFEVVKQVFLRNVHTFTDLSEDVFIPEDEIGYLTIHFAAAIERHIGLGVDIKVITACPTGIGTSRLVASKLESKFNNLHIVDNMSIMDLSNKILEDMEIDLIVATVDISDYMEDGKLFGIDSLVINTLPSDEDYKNIEEKIKYISRKKIYTKGQERLESHLDGHKLKYNIANTSHKTGTYGVRSIYKTSVAYYKLEQRISYSSIGYEKDLIDACADLVASSNKEKELIRRALKERCKIDMPYFEDMGLYLMHCQLEGCESRLGFMNLVDEDIGILSNISSGIQQKGKSIVVMALGKEDLDSRELFAAISSRLVEDSGFLEAISRLDKEKIGYIVNQEIEKQVERLVGI